MMATVGVTEQSNAFANDDLSRRGGGKRKRDNQFESPEAPPSTRRQSSRTQQYPPTANMTGAPDGQHQSQDVTAGLSDPSLGNGHHSHFTADNLTHAHAGPEPSHQSNNQFDISSLGDPSHHGGPNSASAAATNSAVAAAGQATAAAALHSEFTMNVPPHPGSGFGEMPTSGQDDSFALPPGADGLSGDPNAGSAANKPAVGSEEWHKVRKDNHKEVERRRRETINEGINELAKIVPGCEKNKGSILARAVQYIQKLQEDASTNIDKWTFEKLVTEQAINELSEKVTKAYREKEAWRRLAKDAGVDVDHVDLGLPDDHQDGIGGVGEPAGLHGVPVGGEQHAMGGGDDGQKDGQPA